MRLYSEKFLRKQKHAVKIEIDVEGREREREEKFEIQIGVERRCVGSNSSPLFAIQKYIIIIFYLDTDKSLCTTPLFALPVGSCDNRDDIMMSMLCYLIRTKMLASRVGTPCSYYMDF